MLAFPRIPLSSTAANVLLHGSCRVPELEAQFGVDPALLSHNLPHILASIGIMAVPGLMAWGSDAVMRLAFEHKPLPAVAAATTAEAAAAVPAPARGPRKSPRGGMGAANGMALAATATVAAAAGTTTTAATTAAATKPIVPFLSLSYGYLPLVWAATLAHYLPNFLEEAGLILPVTAATFGLNGAGLPSFVADHAVTEFLQVWLLRCLEECHSSNTLLLVWLPLEWDLCCRAWAAQLLDCYAVSNGSWVAGLNHSRAAHTTWLQHSCLSASCE